MYVEVFVARQPVFDSLRRVWGYELLFRSSLENRFIETDASEATCRVIANSFFSTITQEKLLEGKRGLINFSRDLLVGDFATTLEPETAVIEVLETVEADAEVLAACRRLKERGYLLALDDFVSGPGSEPLTELADIIKVDFLNTEERERAELARRYGRRGIRMLAEKVETHEDFEQARRIGYTYFQGYFFARPVILARREIPSSKLNCLRLLKEVRQPEIRFERIEGMIKHDVSLSFNLLRFINSARLGLRQRVESIQHALVLLGEVEVRKWVTIVAMSRLADNKPQELLVQAVTRGRFCELMSAAEGLKHRESDLFLLGMFSLLDAIVDQPLSTILSEVRVAEDVRQTLLGAAPEGTPLRDIYETVLAYEGGNWTALSETAAHLKTPEERLPPLYFEAVRWTGEIEW